MVAFGSSTVHPDILQYGRDFRGQTIDFRKLQLKQAREDADRRNLTNNLFGLSGFEDQQSAISGLNPLFNLGFGGGGQIGQPGGPDSMLSQHGGPDSGSGGLGSIFGDPRDPNNIGVPTGYQNLTDSVLADLSRTGEGRRGDIEQSFKELQGTTSARLADRGLGSGSILSSLGTGIERGKQRELTNLDSSLASISATAKGNIGLAGLGTFADFQKAELGRRTELMELILGPAAKQFFGPSIGSLYSGDRGGLVGSGY